MLTISHTTRIDNILEDTFYHMTEATIPNMVTTACVATLMKTELHIHNHKHNRLCVNCDRCSHMHNEPRAEHVDSINNLIGLL